MMALAEEEVELRTLENEIEENFKPLFDKHGSEGIEINELRRELEDEGLLKHIGTSRMNELFAKADRNKNQYLTYHEFYRMVTEDMTDAERDLPSRQVARAAIAHVIPRREREDFLANYDCLPPPIFIPLISCIEIGIFVYYVFDLQDHGIQTTATSGCPQNSPLVYKPTRRYEVWRFVSYMFIHQGYQHIFYNILFQFLFGLPLEIVHKWWRIGVLYTVGVTAGCLLHSVTEIKTELVGASGGVYAIFGIHVAAIIINWREMDYKCFDPEEMDHNFCCSCCRIFLSAPVRLAIICFITIPNTGFAIYRRITEPDTFKSAVTAHIGGFLAGILMGVVLVRNIKILSWEKALGWVMLAVFLIFVAFCAIFNMFYPGYPKTDWGGW